MVASWTGWSVLRSRTVACCPPWSSGHATWAVRTSSLKAYLDKAAPIAALTRLQGRQPEGDTHNLTDAEMEAARLTGISPADYAKAKGA